MGVSQQSIADALGLSRTTVTKILNRDPKYSASEATRDLVFRTAEKMGYDFTTIRRPFKREYGRTEVNAPCMVEVVLENGEIFDKGEAVARNIGVGGVLLTNIRLIKQALPLKQFSLRVRFRDLPELANLIGECQVVRISDSVEAGEPELGVKFINASVSDRKLLKDFIDRRVAEAMAMRQKNMEAREGTASGS
ncbi:MAG: PilZ domain-containing protein [Planctomycetota bacterium]|nr:PilZ domain-containing protein [Planctomycetota bacterium]